LLLLLQFIIKLYNFCACYVPPDARLQKIIPAQIVGLAGDRTRATCEALGHPLLSTIKVAYNSPKWTVKVIVGHKSLF
jgi:hypothetical protein